MEATNLALQNRLDIIDRKAQLSESTLKKLTKERDMAVSQLGVAYLESQDSKTENEKLRRENAELRTQLSKFVTLKSREDTTGRSEQTAATDDGDADDSQVYTQRSSNVSRNTKDQMSKNARASRSKPVRDEDTRSKVSNQVDKEISRLEKERAEEALFSIDFPQSGRVSKHDRSEGRSGSRKGSNTGKQRVKRVVVEEVDVTDPADTMTEEATRQTRRSSQGDNDLSLLSFVDVSFFPPIPLLIVRFVADNGIYRNAKLLNCARRWKKSVWHASNDWLFPRTKPPIMKPPTPPVRAAT